MTAQDELEKAENDVTVEKSQFCIFNTIDTLVKSDRLDPFFRFGYQLRKKDNDDDFYTQAFFKLKQWKN